MTFTLQKRQTVEPCDACGLTMSRGMSSNLHSCSHRLITSCFHIKRREAERYARLRLKPNTGPAAALFYEKIRGLQDLLTQIFSSRYKVINVIRPPIYAQASYQSSFLIASKNLIRKICLINDFAE